MKIIVQCENFDDDYPVTASEVLTALKNCYPAAKFTVRELPGQGQGKIDLSDVRCVINFIIEDFPGYEDAIRWSDDKISLENYSWGQAALRLAKAAGGEGGRRYAIQSW